MWFSAIKASLTNKEENKTQAIEFYFSLNSIPILKFVYKSKRVSFPIQYGGI
jgi:hypothetical protein